MKFSLIIPTKNRQKTAIYAIQSGILSNYENIEIIVSDVSDDDSLHYKIKELNDPRIKYYYHKKSLSMRDNWEFAVSKATGDYVSIIGDDDALMPDGFSLAEMLIKKSSTKVLYCISPNYKWPDYTFINRRNLLVLNLPTTVVKISDPKKKLRLAYEFKEKAGTGPGIYHGLIERKFLDELKAKRGSYFKDNNPDFDSGFSTLLYLDSYLQTNYPIFLSGHCAASNSGSMNTKASYHQGLSDFLDDSSSEVDEVMWAELENLVSIEAGLVSCMRRFLPEVNRNISGKKIKLNKQNIFNLVARGIQGGYDNTTFKAEVEILKKIAKKWNVSTEAIPAGKKPSLGIIAEKGINTSAIVDGDHTKNLFIDGNALGITDISDAIKVVDGLTVNWTVLLQKLGHVKNVAFCANPPNSLETITVELQNGNYQKAKALLEDNIIANPLDDISLLFMGIMYFNRQMFREALPFLARSLSFKFSLNAFDAYFHSLVKTNQLTCARLVLDNYSDEISETNNQLTEHCIGVLEMASGNYENAAVIFEKIKPQIDHSLYFYCSAYANFLKGEAANANEFVKKALNFNKNKKEYLELEAKIVAAL